MNGEFKENEFPKILVSAYKQLETGSEYDERQKNEEADIQTVVQLIKGINEGKVNPEDLSSYGITKEAENVKDSKGNTIVSKMEYSKQSIIKMARLLNAANNISLPGRDVVKDLCTLPGVSSILYEMSGSPRANNLIEQAQKAKEAGYKGEGASRGETPAEKDKQDAKKEMEDLKRSGYPDEKLYSVIEDKQNWNGGYDSKGELAIAKILARQEGKIAQGKYVQDMGKYVVESSQEPEKTTYLDNIKKDTKDSRYSFIKKWMDKIRDIFRKPSEKSNEDHNRE